MPPRPQSPFTRAQSQLQEAFPSIEPNVIRAVLVASGGKLDPAFNALLSMSDPDFKPDEALQAAAGGGGGVNQSQLEQDEALARQLAEQEDRRRGGRGHPPPPLIRVIRLAECVVPKTQPDPAIQVVTTTKEGTHRLQNDHSLMTICQKSVKTSKRASTILETSSIPG